MSLDVDKATAEALQAAAANNAAAAKSAETWAKLVREAESLATKDYVDEGDAETLASAKAYTDGHMPSLTWNAITGKPSTFPPSSHTHAMGEVTNLTTQISSLQTQVSQATQVAVQASNTANAASSQAQGAQTQLSTHLTAENPHGITPSKIGAVPTNNTGGTTTISGRLRFYDAIEDNGGVWKLDYQGLKLNGTNITATFAAKPGDALLPLASTATLAEVIAAYNALLEALKA